MHASGPSDHLLLLHRTEGWLARRIAELLVTGGLATGAILVTSAERWAALADALLDHGLEVEALVAAGVVVHKESAGMLARLLAADLDPAALHAELAPAVALVRSATGEGRIFAYGDMVDVLWQRGDHAAAGRLEAAWHAVLRTEELALHCAYRVDTLDPTAPAGPLLAVCRAHGGFCGVEDGALRREAIREGIEAVLGAREAGRLDMVLAGAGLPTGAGEEEAAIAWLRTQVPRIAQRVMTVATGLLASGARAG